MIARSIIGILLGSFSVALHAQFRPPDGGGEFSFIPEDRISQSQHNLIQHQIDSSKNVLRSLGKLNDVRAEKTATVSYAFPLAWNDGFSGYNFFGISNFVDHDPGFPGVLLDYNCGNRTYDTESGYNHAGIDYFLWPFDWNMMEDGAVQIIAAAPGTIVYKSDGNFDHNCEFNNSNWNAVYIENEDGSTTWYGHMKNGSTTAKSIGEHVDAGEYLGLVGSSGNSTGPHLHLETYDVDGNLIDPYAGACNNFNIDTWWVDQETYYHPQINSILTHSQAPDFNTCPDTAETYIKDEFSPGDVVFFIFYARDLRNTDTCHLQIVQPDLTVWQEWDFLQPFDYFSASYWFYYYFLPPDAQEGSWKWVCQLDGQNYEHTFYVNSITSASNSTPHPQDLMAQYTDHSIQIHYSSAAACDMKVMLLSANAQILDWRDQVIRAGENAFQIDALNFASGLYFIQLSEESTGISIVSPVVIHNSY